MRSVVKVFSSDVVSKVLLGGSGILLIRYMPEGEYAVYTLCFSIISIVSQFLTGTFDRIFVVGFNRFKINDRIPNFLLLEVAILTLLLLIAFPFAGSVESLYPLLALLSFATCIYQFIKVTFQQEMKFSKIFLLELSRAIIFSLSIILLIFTFRYGVKASWVILAQSFGLIMISLVFFSRIKIPLNKFSLADGFELGCAIFKGVYSYLVAFVFAASFFSQINILMLSAMTDSYSVASYGSAYRYFSLLCMLLTAVHVVMLPTVQRVDSHEKMLAIYRDFSKFACCVTPFILLGMKVSAWLMPLVDGGKYPQSITIFQLLSVSALLSFWLSPHINILMKTEDFRFLFSSHLIGLLLFFCLNLVLIPHLSGVGAAVSHLISYFFINMVVFLRSKKILMRMRVC